MASFPELSGQGAIWLTMIISAAGMWAVLSLEHAVSVARSQSLRWADVLLTLCVAIFALLAGWFLHFDPLPAAALIIASASAISLIRTDLRLGQLADLHTLILAVCGLVAAPMLNPELSWITMALGAGLAIAILGLAGLYARWRKGRLGLGQGDILLAGAGGVWTGMGLVGPALFIGATITALFALVMKKPADQKLAFAPGLIFGFVVAVLIGIRW